MKLTQKDYDTRKNRVTSGDGTDEDRRLVKHYERQGFVQKPRGGPVEDTKAYDEAQKSTSSTVAVSTASVAPTGGPTRAPASVSGTSVAPQKKG